MPQFAIQMRQISKSYDGFYANKKIDFSVRAGTIHALAGENGAGKSTLMKILFGLEKPNPDISSEILIHEKSVNFKSPLEAIQRGLGMVQQHFALSGALTPLENIVLGSEPLIGPFLDRVGAEKNISALAQEELKLPWHLQTDALSVGAQQRIEILKLLFRKSDILILDEPTGVLTPQEIERFFTLLRRLKESGKTIVIITHKLNEIFALCDEVTVLRQGAIAGHFEIPTLTQDKLIEAMIGRTLKPRIKIKNTFVAHQNVIEVKNLTLKKVERGSISNLCFEIKPGEILGIAGVEGNGQKTLVEALLGLENSEGIIKFEGREIYPKNENVRRDLNFALVSEDRHSQSLWLEGSIAQNCIIGLEKKFSKFGMLIKNRINTFSISCLAPYEVKMQNLEQKVKSLSGGNQQKVVIGREITGRKSKFAIICQPTRGVDIGAIEHIHAAILELAKRGCAVLLISSELDELFYLSDRISVLNEGCFVHHQNGPDFDSHKLGEAMISQVKVTA